MQVAFNLCHSAERCAAMLPTPAMDAPRYHLPEEEIGLGEPAAVTGLLRDMRPATHLRHTQSLEETCHKHSRAAGMYTLKPESLLLLRLLLLTVLAPVDA